MRPLPAPSSQQAEAFARHLVDVHSWYKHLPLLGGGEIIIFADPRAGEGYPLQHPRLPTTNTAPGYREAFGHLNYLYRCWPGEEFCADGAVPPALAEVFTHAARFTLYPYVSSEFYWSAFCREVEMLKAGLYHPQRATILAAVQADVRKDRAWDSLTDTQRDTVSELDDTQTVPTGLPTQVTDYLDAVGHYDKIMDDLRTLEVVTIRHYVHGFRTWMLATSG